MHSFISLLFVFLLAIGVTAAQPQDSPFHVGDIKATEVSPGVIDVKLTTQTVKKVTLPGTVPVPTAPLFLDGEIRVKAFIEADLLGSLMPVDLNGDGQFNQILIRETKKGLRIDGMLVEPMSNNKGRQEPFRKNGKMKRYRLDPDAPEFSILYDNYPDMGLLLAHRTERPEVLELPNPNLQLIVFEHSPPVNGERFLPTPPAFELTIDGKEPAEKHLLYAWEPKLFNSLNLSPRWFRAWWISVPLNTDVGTTEHHLQVKTGLATTSLGLYAQINYTTEKGVRFLTDRSVGIIWARPKSD
jgi:hypothetical protein